MRAVTRLIDKGFEAYLVGGCVRDLLLDRTPKDYDIATEARPPQVKRTFPRNCRIIGRRFKLAHLHFHGNTKILECSTFRRTPQEKPEGANGAEEDLLITRDNEFGTAEEDALRRDFTINALFLDPTRNLIVDHVHGLEDIEARVIRTIGDPVVRFREDPVRILRAVKFAGRLGFEIEKKTFAAMAETAEDLTRAAPPRVLEEILRLLRSGHAHDSFELLRDVGAIQFLIPVVGKFLKQANNEQHDAFWTLLDALDHHVQAQPDGREPPPNGVLLAVLMYGAVEAAREREPTRSASSLAEKLLGSLAVDLRLPRRDSGCLKRICGVQHRFVQSESKRRFRVESFVHSPYFEEALQLFELRMAAAGDDAPEATEETIDGWHELRGSRPVDAGADEHGGEHGGRDDEDGRDEEAAPRKKRRRRRRRRQDDDEQDEAGASTAEAASDPANDESADTSSAKANSAKASSAKDSAAEEHAAEDGDVEEKVAPKRPAKKAAKKATRRKRQKRATSDDDLSDVTFPASEEPSPHGDPLAGHDAKEWTRSKPEAGEFPQYDDGLEHDENHDNDSDRKTEEPQARAPRRRSRAQAERPEPERRDSEHRGPDRDDTDHDRSDEPELEQPEVEQSDCDEADRPASRRKRGRRSRAVRDDEPQELVVGDEAQDSDRDDDDRGDEDRSELDDQDREGQAQGEAPTRKRRRRSRGGRGRRGRGDDEQDARREEHPDDARDGESRDGESREGDARDQDAGDADDARRSSKVKAKKGNSRRRNDSREDSNRDGESKRSESGRNNPKRRDSKRGDSKRGDSRRPDSKRGDNKRGKSKKPPRRSGGRDVDVVPRYRDRRGKVEVIEPVSLDLSAFDVELDPKRVPTFGTIVEGKGRPKRRGPRIPDKGSDEYKPPPPPGGDGGPSASPSPPPSDDPDTFGDW